MSAHTAERPPCRKARPLFPHSLLLALFQNMRCKKFCGTQAYETEIPAGKAFWPAGCFFRMRPSPSFPFCRQYAACFAGDSPRKWFLRYKKAVPLQGERLCCLERVYRRENAQALACAAATAQATVMPTRGWLPAPIRPIISTCAGTMEEPANWASPCIRPIESVRP